MKSELEKAGFCVHGEDERDLRFVPIDKYCSRKNKNFDDTVIGLMYMYHHPAGVYFYKDAVTRQWVSFHRRGFQLSTLAETIIIMIYNRKGRFRYDNRCSP